MAKQIDPQLPTEAEIAAHQLPPEGKALSIDEMKAADPDGFFSQTDELVNTNLGSDVAPKPMGVQQNG